jgi:Tol biopolymer transport system component
VSEYPSLSPDGKWIVYDCDQTGNADIYLQGVGGLNSIDLTKDSPDDDTQPAFSPDGERIAFRSERQGGGIFAMGRTGESVRRVADSGFNPAWSPDGTQLVFATKNANPLARGQNSELWKVTLATGDKLRIYGGMRSNRVGHHMDNGSRSGVCQGSRPSGTSGRFPQLEG